MKLLKFALVNMQERKGPGQGGTEYSGGTAMSLVSAGVPAEQTSENLSLIRPTKLQTF